MATLYAEMVMDAIEPSEGAPRKGSKLGDHRQYVFCVPIMAISLAMKGLGQILGPACDSRFQVCGQERFIASLRICVCGDIDEASDRAKGTSEASRII